jgi:hypothetical protein
MIMMPAGKYYVGDLCYVMSDDEWNQFCDLTIKGRDVVDGEFQMPDGRRFATYCTAWGDGLYKDQYGNKYSVDAGLIGCIRVEDIRAEKYENIEQLGAIHTFETDFVTGGGRSTPAWGGTIQFGRVAIETNPESDDEEEDDWDYGGTDE